MVYHQVVVKKVKMTKDISHVALAKMKVTYMVLQVFDINLLTSEVLKVQAKTHYTCTACIKHV